MFIILIKYSVGFSAFIALSLDNFHLITNLIKLKMSKHTNLAASMMQLDCSKQSKGLSQGASKINTTAATSSML